MRGCSQRTPVPDTRHIEIFCALGGVAATTTPPTTIPPRDAIARAAYSRLMPVVSTSSMRSTRRPVMSTPPIKVGGVDKRSRRVRFFWFEVGTTCGLGKGNRNAPAGAKARAQPARFTSSLVGCRPRLTHPDREWGTHTTMAPSRDTSRPRALTAARRGPDR
jgi:hypothetical protein